MNTSSIPSTPSCLQIFIALGDNGFIKNLGACVHTKIFTSSVPKGMQFSLLEESRDFNFDQNYTENTNIYNPKQISTDS